MLSGRAYSVTVDQPYGPCTALVTAMLERAARLTPAEGQAIWDAQLASNADDVQFRAALQTVVHTSHSKRRETAMRLAENAGRAAVTLFPGTAFGDAIGGYVGRLAEALVVSDAVDTRTLLPLTGPWLEVIGSFDEDGP